jgi:hypothetical protein
LRNVHPLIAELVQKPEGGIDGAMYAALRTTLSLDDALDLAEINAVGMSWHAAAHRNADKLAERVKKANERIAERTKGRNR